MKHLIEQAKRAGAMLRINYRSDDEPTLHIECYTDTYQLELCGDVEDLEEMCAAMCSLLDVVDPAENVPF